jgi:hypothetical protein
MTKLQTTDRRIPMTERKPQGTDRRLRLSRGFLFGPALLVLSGCLGDQVGGEGEAGYFCIEKERRTITTSETTSLGFTVEDILAFASGASETDLGWSIPSEYGGLALMPEAGETTLSLDVSSEVVRASVVTQEPNDSGPDTALECPPFVEIETELRLSTANGAFDETLPLVLRAENATRASAVVDLDPASLQGSFELDQVGPLTASAFEHQPERSEFDRTVLYLELTPERVNGVMMGEYTVFFGDGPNDAVSGVEVPFGRIEGGDPCYEEDFGGTLDDGEAVSRLSTLLADPITMDFVWSDDLPDQQLVLQIEPGSFCLGEGAVASLAFSADVVLSDAESDEPVGIWPLSGRATYGADGAFRGATLSHGVYLAPADLGKAIGDLDMDFSDADVVWLVAELELGPEDAWSGQLTLHSVQTVDDRDPPCQSEPVASDAGAGSCSGAFEASHVAATAIMSEVVR